MTDPTRHSITAESAMLLREEGFYRELTLGAPADPGLLEAVCDVPQPFEDRIVSYLASGQIFGFSPGFEYDIFDDGRMCGTPSLLTDGVWVWPEVLAYYVETYHVRISPDFVRHMQSRRWQPPEEPIDLSVLEFSRMPS